jgi:protein ImuB
MRTAVVWCPDWPLAAAGVEDTTRAVVMADGRVYATSAAAREDGVRRGMRLRDAQRRSANLHVLDADLAGEMRAYGPVLAVLERFTPMMEIVRPGLCAFRARGPARYFGGEEALTALVTGAVVEVAGRGQVGIADGLFAAELAARERVAVPPGDTRGYLAGWPVSVLDRPELAGLLVRLGIRTLGAFAALPAGDVHARFGPDGALAHRLASGLQARPLVPHDPPPDLSVEAEIDPPSDRVDQATFLAKALADTLHERLAARGLICTQLAVEAVTEHGEQLSRVWRHDGLSSAAVADRVRWQLDGWIATGVPTSGVRLLRLSAREVAASGTRQLDLSGRTDGATSADGGKVDRAFARVQGLLGPDGLLTLQPAGGRDPGARWHWLSWGEVTPPHAPPDQPWPGRIPSPGPAVLYPEPPAADVLDPAGDPVAVSGRYALSGTPTWLVTDGGERRPITGWAGPWPADERWWDPAHARRRARFQLVTGDGTAYLAAVEHGRWRLEGMYD